MCCPAVCFGLKVIWTGINTLFQQWMKCREAPAQFSFLFPCFHQLHRVLSSVPGCHPLPFSGLDWDLNPVFSLIYNNMPSCPLLLHILNHSAELTVYTEEQSCDGMFFFLPEKCREQAKEKPGGQNGFICLRLCEIRGGWRNAMNRKEISGRVRERECERRQFCEVLYYRMSKLLQGQGIPS